MSGFPPPFLPYTPGWSRGGRGAWASPPRSLVSALLASVLSLCLSWAVRVERPRLLSASCRTGVLTRDIGGGRMATSQLDGGKGERKVPIRDYVDTPRRYNNNLGSRDDGRHSRDQEGPERTGPGDNPLHVQVVHANTEQTRKRPWTNLGRFPFVPHPTRHNQRRV